MTTFLSKIMDSAQDVRVSDSNERLNEYIQGVLRKSDLESFVAVAPRRDGYRIYVGEDMENPFAYVDVYLDGESLVVEGSSKRHLSDAEMGDLARFLGINGKEAGEKLNRFRKFVDLVRSESGKSVDDLKDAKVSDSGNKSWPEEYREKLHAVPVPEKRGRLTEKEEQDIMDRRNGIAVSSVTQLLNSMGYDAKGDELDITVRGNEKSAEIRVGGLHNSDGFLAINVEGGRTEYFDITDAESWISYLRSALGGFVKDSGIELSEEEKLGGKLPSDDEMLDMLRADASPKTLSRIARMLKEQGRTSLKDGNTEVMAVAEYPNGALVYSFKQKAWQEAVNDSCKKVKDSDDESYKEELRTIYESYEDGSIMGTELEEELERFVDDNDIPSDMVSEIHERIDEFTIARKHASRDGGRTPDGRDEFHSWFESFYSKVCDSKEVKDSGAEGIAENDTEGVTEESLNEAIRKAGEETKTDLTEEEKQSGDYPKGVVEVQGMSIVIENPKGSTRSGVDADGNKWSTEMQDTYGYFEGTAGADTDDIDVFVGEHPLSDKVFIVDQVKKDGSFDEHKVMFGYESSEDAREAYLRNYEDGWQGLGSITQVSVEDFRRWAEADKTRDKAFTEYIKVQDSNVRPQDFGQTHRIKVDGVYYTNGNTITVDGKQGRVTRFGKDSAEVRLDDGSTITVKGEVTKIPDSMSEGGVSTTKSGEEKYEKFTTRVGRKSRTMYQYDYRTPDGELFSCVAPSLESCRAKRDAWLEKRGQKVQDDEYFRDAKGTTIMLEDRVRVLNPTTNNTDFIGDFGIVEGLDDDGYIHVQLDNIDQPLMFDSREVVVINRKVGDSETMRIFGKDYKKGDTLVDSDGVRARIMYRDGNDAIVLTEKDNKWYRLPIKDAMDPNEDKDENIHVNWKISDLEKYLRKPASMRRGKKVEDSKSIDKKALGEWLVGAADRAINSFGDGTVYYKDLGDGHSIVLDWVEGYDNDENNPFVKDGYGLEASLRKTKSSFFVGDWEYAYDDSSMSLEGSDKDDKGERVIDYLMSFKEDKVEDSKEDFTILAVNRDGDKVESIKKSLQKDGKSMEDYRIKSIVFKSEDDGALYDFNLYKVVMPDATYYIHDMDEALLAEGDSIVKEFITKGTRKEVNPMTGDVTIVEDTKELPRRDFVFPADSTMVNDGKGHFPLNSLNRGRAALAFVARYDKLPKWYSGDMSLEEFKDHVRSEVKKAYPSIEVSDSAESGSGSFDFNEVHHDLAVAHQKVRQYLDGKDSDSMTEADWDISDVSSAISRAMRTLYLVARKQGQTTDYTNVKDDCKVYDAKESTEDMWARICDAGEITEREINLLNRRLNAEGRDTLDYDLIENRFGLALTHEQERKALAWLNNQWKTSTGKERKNNPFGYREEKILENATDVTFIEFYNAGNSFVNYFLPVYRVYSSDGSFTYYVQGGEVNIVG